MLQFRLFHGFVGVTLIPTAFLVRVGNIFVGVPLMQQH
jgi:hypothetical protein